MALCVPPIVVGQRAVNTLPQQSVILGGTTLYVVCVESKESRRLDLPRTYCLNFWALALPTASATEYIEV
jgi:hypothetical protein